MMSLETLITYVVLAALPLIFAITLHEAAHGYVARHFGDTTAERAGRISLNPMQHIDPVGTILVPVLLFLISLGSFSFGWAKPVPVNFGALRHPKKDMLWVALAGPAANLFMAMVWALVASFAQAAGDGYFSVPLYLMAIIGVRINLVFMVLNLVPIPPLDGGRIAVSLLPYPYAIRFARLERWGMFILIILIVSQVLGLVLWPVVNLLVAMINSIFGLNIPLLYAG
jgi:Zn-dependent protease